MNVRLARGARGILAASAKEWEMMVRSSCLMPSILRAEVQGAAAATGAATGEARIAGAKRVERKREIVGVEKSIFGFGRWDGYVVPRVLGWKAVDFCNGGDSKMVDEREGIPPEEQTSTNIRCSSIRLAN